MPLCECGADIWPNTSGINDFALPPPKLRAYIASKLI